MAKDALGTVITLGIVGVGGWWLYSSGILSSLFGSPAAAAPTTPPVTNPPPAGGTNPVPATPTPTSLVPPAVVSSCGTGPCGCTGVIAPAGARALAAQPWTSLTDPAALLNMDQWNYYLNQVCSGLSNQVGSALDPASLFPNDPNRGGPINFAAYSGYAKAAGLSAVRGRRRRGVTMIGTHPVRRVA